MNFRRHIRAVVNTLENRKPVKKSAMEVMNQIVTQIFKAICREAANLREHSDAKVLRSDSFKAATKLLFPEEMAKFALEEAHVVQLKYTQTEGKAGPAAEEPQE